MTKLTEDHAHVLLDAVDIARNHVGKSSLECPWRDYAVDDSDPKTKEDTWRALLREAEAALGALLNKGGEVEI